jgi:hypothetical protein
MEGIFEEARISADGEKVVVTVHGVKGAGCGQLQDKYKVLGPQGEGVRTEEFYEAPIEIPSNVQIGG